MTRFEDEFPSLESYWRAIVLFGKNSASYKFALAKTLLGLVKPEVIRISLDDLAFPYAQNIAQHLELSDRQGTSTGSQFLESIRQFNQGKISEQGLHKITVQKGFVNVLDAFHNVNNGEIPVRFFDKDGSAIVVTDELLSLKENLHFDDLSNEAEARWRLVETAWSLGLSRNVVQIDSEDSEFNTIITTDRRMDVTSTRDALNGYQKGKCFYCYSDISLQSGDDDLCEVDHFFPWTLRHSGLSTVLLNGIWNLVLACKSCNGSNGKSAKLPLIRFLERLQTRNDFLIDSHHPLRETLIHQTGSTSEQRHKFLSGMDHDAIQVLIHRWGPEFEYEPVF